MATVGNMKSPRRLDDLPVIAIDMPVMYEDEGQEEMGEAEPHTITDQILYNGLKAHVAGRPEYRKYHVFSNLNLLYHPIKRRAYVSPDAMIVAPVRKLRQNVKSYRVGTTGPAPVLTVEILSERSYQQQDLHNKPKIYANLRVPEYILVDVTAEFLPEKLLLRRLSRTHLWKDERDPDGGVTSRLGFRLIIDRDGDLRVVDVLTGRRYLRPDEAQAEAEARNVEAEARRRAELRVHELEEELAQLRSTIRERRKNGR